MCFYLKSITCPSWLQNRKFLVGVGMKGVIPLGIQTLNDAPAAVKIFKEGLSRAP